MFRPPTTIRASVAGVVTLLVLVSVLVAAVCLLRNKIPHLCKTQMVNGPMIPHDTHFMNQHLMFEVQLKLCT